MTVEKIGFIGAGHIAESMIRGFITSGRFDPGEIVISDVSQERLLQMHRMLGACMASGNPDTVLQSRVVFLSVKPGQVMEVAREIRGDLTPGHFVVSIAAGTALRRLREGLGEGPRLCRIMPNLAASVRRSTIGLYADPNLSDEDIQPIRSLLSQIGQVFTVDHEPQMAVITALSGSAPAYYVMMAEALVSYGVSHGISREMAQAMILSTMEGSAAWARNAKIPLSQLWRKVVTPGGTTEAGISYYDQKGFVEIFVEGLIQSTKRARELGDE